MIEKTDEALGLILQKLAAVAEAHAGDAVLLGGKVLQLQVAATMVGWTVAVAFGAYSLSRFFHHFRSPTWTAKNGEDPPGQVIGWGIASAVLGIIGGIGFVINVLSPLHWAILFDARLAIAAKVLGLI